MTGSHGQSPRDVPREVRGALEALVAPFRPLFAAHGLTEQQWRVLRALQDGVTSQVELAEACVMHPASLTGVLARMQRVGLVERRRSADDQRKVEVALTTTGDELVLRLLPEVAERYRELARKVGAEALEDLAGAAAVFRERAS